MKILVIDEAFPYPLDTGKKIRTFNLFSRLGRNHEIRYLAYGSSDEPGYRALLDCGISPLPVSYCRPANSSPLFYVRLFCNLFSRYPYSVSSHRTTAFERAIIEDVQAHSPDVIIAEWTPYAVFLDSVTGSKKVIVSHNVESDIWGRYYENETNRLKKWYIGHQFRKMERFEREVVKTANGITAVSELDARTMRSFGQDLSVEVIENGVDLDYFQPAPTPGDAPCLVFTGSMDWRPNQDAAQYFVNDIFPLLKRRTPQMSATFVGRDPSPGVKQLADVPGITITGKVDDVRPYVRNASVYIVPLRIGGGSRLKILEALAMMRPVVSTSVGAEGLNVKHNEQILLADSPSDFAACIERLLGDTALRGRLISAGRNLVEKEYGWDMLAAKLEQFLVRVASSL